MFGTISGIGTTSRRHYFQRGPAVSHHHTPKISSRGRKSLPFTVQATQIVIFEISKILKIEMTLGQPSPAIGMVHVCPTRNVVSRSVCNDFWHRFDVSAPLLSARTCGQSPCRHLKSAPGIENPFLSLALCHQVVVLKVPK